MGDTELESVTSAVQAVAFILVLTELPRNLFAGFLVRPLHRAALTLASLLNHRHGPNLDHLSVSQSNLAPLSLPLSELPVPLVLIR